MILKTPDGKTAGKIEGNTFITSRERSKHLMRMFNGYGISQSVLSILHLENVSVVEIHEKPANKVYKIFLKEYLQSKLIYSFGGDVQNFVPIFKMTRKESSNLNYWMKEVAQ